MLGDKQDLKVASTLPAAVTRGQGRLESPSSRSENWWVSSQLWTTHSYICFPVASDLFSVLCCAWVSCCRKGPYCQFIDLP